MEKTYTEEQYAALASQVAGLEAKVAELTAATETSAVDAAVAAAKAELETQIADLQTQLDTAVLEAQASKEAHDSLVALLEETAAAEAAAAELAERRDARVAAVKEVASFPDDYLEANADRFAAMSDEAFTAAIEDWKTIAPKATASASKDDEIPTATAMTASRSTETGSSPLREVMNLRFAGVDTRTV